jgi:glycosyltransferase involved in cell wall biosynthesis
MIFMFSKHPSYQPLEYMASGCAVVTNMNEANSWLLRHRENAMVVPPLRTTVVEAIEELMGNEGLRQELIRVGLASVSRTSWEQELDVAYRFVTKGEARAPGERGDQEIPSSSSSRTGGRSARSSASR